MSHAVRILAIRILQATAILIAASVPSISQALDETSASRTRRDLQALYDFSQSSTEIVSDQAGHAEPLHLKISDPDRAHQNGGQLNIAKPTMIRSNARPARLMKAVRDSGEITVEVWLKTADLKQSGPARILTLSKNSSERNFTLGQDGNRIDARLRTTATSLNGIPSVTTPASALAGSLVHVTYTHAKSGQTRIYVDGHKVSEQSIKGQLTNWDSSMSLVIGNEASSDRPWLGSLHLVAIYSRALSAKEVDSNFRAGPTGKPSAEQLAEQKLRLANRHFQTVVAPILANHCLECHDAFHHEGGLNLSSRKAAFRGGDNGAVIIPGKAAASPLWVSVESESMPHNRKPLNADQKAALKRWIDDDDAAWNLDTIDPAVYVHGSSNQNWVQRLTVDEYIETVRAALGVDIAREARELLPHDLRADGFSNTAYNLTVDLKHVNAYAQLAEIIVGRMDVPKFVARFSKRNKFTDNDMGDVISKVGHWVLRGPIRNEELIAYRGITTTVASAGGTFEEAASLVLEAMLQSPRFIYRIEQQRGDGAVLSVSEHELASRLSYILWGGPPDKGLLKAADDGQLSTTEFDAQVARMLQDPKAKQQSLRFITDWLNLNRMENLRPNADRFPKWNPQLARDMKQETLAFFDHIVWTKQQRLSALLNAEVTFVTPELRKFYGLPTVSGADSDADSLQSVELKKVPGRGGLLTQGSLLTVGGDNASMVTRGLLVMHELLRGVVKDPPPCVDTTPVPTRPGLTQRSIAMERVADASCGGCHEKFEPLAFGLERFNGIGVWREQDEHGNALREDGSILFPGSAKVVRYRTSKELMNLLAESDRVRQSLTWKVTQFSLSRPLVAEDAAIVDQIHAVAESQGGTWTAVMTAIVNGDLVRRTRTQPLAD